MIRKASRRRGSTCLPMEPPEDLNYLRPLGPIRASSLILRSVSRARSRSSPAGDCPAIALRDELTGGGGRMQAIFISSIACRVTKSFPAIRMICRRPLEASVLSDDGDSRPPKNSRQASLRVTGSSSLGSAASGWLRMSKASQVALRACIPPLLILFKGCECSWGSV